MKEAADTASKRGNKEIKNQPCKFHFFTQLVVIACMLLKIIKIKYRKSCRLCWIGSLWCGCWYFQFDPDFLCLFILWEKQILLWERNGNVHWWILWMAVGSLVSNLNEICKCYQFLFYFDARELKYEFPFKLISADDDVEKKNVKLEIDHQNVVKNKNLKSTKLNGKWDAIIIQNFLFLDRTFFFPAIQTWQLFKFLFTHFFIVTRFAHSVFNLKWWWQVWMQKWSKMNCFVYSVTVIAHVDTDWKVKHATLVNILSLKNYI